MTSKAGDEVMSRDELRRTRARRSAEQSRQDRISLTREIAGLCNAVGGEFLNAYEYVPGTMLGPSPPEPANIRLATLRRLHEALTRFYAEAQADDDAKLRREVERDR
jgi:hypothetical protein